MTSERTDDRRAGTEGRRRAVRSDAGEVRCSPRDLELLRIVGEQYAISLPQLARLMGCSGHAARWLRSRWERAGWARGRALVVGRPVFVWLTRRGQRIAGSDYALWRPNPGMLAHIDAVTEVRLDVAARHPGAEWVCERELYRELGAPPAARRRHTPDGLVVVDGREVAVEVELTLKRRARMERIMRELVARYGSVTYFAASAPRRSLERLADEVGGGRVQVLGLPAGATR
jgi:DNA-binding CsgD family transcriptional regulator